MGHSVLIIPFKSGFLATTICFGIATVIMLILRANLIRENRRRDKLQQSNFTPEESGPLEISDETDSCNMNFRYVY